MRKLASASWKVWKYVPNSVKKIVRSSPTLNRYKKIVANKTMHVADHNDIYDEVYYQGRETEQGRQSITNIADSIAECFTPKTVLDVGSGAGLLLDKLVDRGLTVIGLELSDAAIQMCQVRGLDVRKFDIEKDPPPDLENIDLVVSMEVAEHLPASCADRYIDILCNSFGNQVVVFTAATPGQGGRDHVNEQPHAYWIEKFAQRGFEFQDAMSRNWRTSWKGKGVLSWYANNVMIFTRTM